MCEGVGVCVFMSAYTHICVHTFHTLWIYRVFSVFVLEYFHFVANMNLDPQISVCLLRSSTVSVDRRHVREVIHH